MRLVVSMTDDEYRAKQDLSRRSFGQQAYAALCDVCLSELLAGIMQRYSLEESDDVRG